MGGADVSLGSTISTTAYDAWADASARPSSGPPTSRRRITNYYSPGGQSNIETRNGSNQTLKQSEERVTSTICDAGSVAWVGGRRLSLLRDVTPPPKPMTLARLESNFLLGSTECQVLI